MTDNEFKTLGMILDTMKFTDKARAFLEPLVHKQSSGTSAYKQIDGVRYDRSCLDLATHLAKDGKLDLADAKQLWASVEDGRQVTETEKRTIEHVMGEHKLTDGAKDFLNEKLTQWQAAQAKK